MQQILENLESYHALPRRAQLEMEEEFGQKVGKNRYYFDELRNGLHDWTAKEVEVFTEVVQKQAAVHIKKVTLK